MTIIPLVPASRPGSSSLPEGSSCVAAFTASHGTLRSRARSKSRASSPLLFGLAPRGVCLAPDVATGAVGSYPTFSPLPAPRTIRRCPEGFPSGYHRVTHRRRYFLCCTFRDQCHRLGFHPPLHQPPGVTRRVALLCKCRCRALARPLHPQTGVRTFLPPACRRQALARHPTREASDHPAHPPIRLYANRTQ